MTPIKITKSSYEIEYTVQWNDNISRYIAVFASPKLGIQGVYLLRDQDFDGYALTIDAEEFIYINFLNSVKQVEQQQANTPAGDTAAQKLATSSESQTGEVVSQ